MGRERKDLTWDDYLGSELLDFLNWEVFDRIICFDLLNLVLSFFCSWVYIKHK
jgi:hypothetical protein